MFTDVPSPHGILAHLRFRRRPLNNASSRYVQQKLFVMPPRGRGGKGGNKAYAGSHKGPNGGRVSKVIDLTEGGLGSSSFGNPLLYPMLQNPLMSSQAQEECRCLDIRASWVPKLTCVLRLLEGILNRTLWHCSCSSRC